MEQIPHKCPVCDGEGQRAKPADPQSSSALPQYRNCRSCHGTGVIWGWKTSEPQYPPVQPSPYWSIYPHPSHPFVQDWETISGSTTIATVSGEYDPDDPALFSTNISNLPEGSWHYTA